MAKAAAGDCERLIAKEGIQIHGGIGYTWEHDMHLYVKRAKSLEPLFGSSSTHRAHIADLLGVPEEWEVLSVIAVGHPTDVLPAAPARRPDDTVWLD